MSPSQSFPFRQVLRFGVAIGLAVSLLALMLFIPNTAVQASNFPAAPLLSDPFTISDPQTTVAAAPLFAPSIAASKRDSLAIDDGDGLAEPGETIRYTVFITNSGPDPATGVGFNDTIDANTTLISSSVNVSPLARNDTYTAVGNTLLEVGITPSGLPAVIVPGSVLDNDSEFLADTFTVQTPVPTTSANGGTVTFQTNGTFRYLPAVGFTGTDTFTYTITDGTLTDTGTVTITVAERVWYVQNNFGGGGSGRSNNPFNTLAAAQTASGINDYIYVANGSGDTSGQNSGIVLKDGQRLLGEGVALIVSGFNLRAAGTRPDIGHGGPGVAVTLAQNNTVRGLDIVNSSTAISGSGFGTLALDNVTINTSGAALNLTTGTANATFIALSSNGGASNVALTNVAGTIDLGTTGALLGATGSNLNINGSTATVTYGGAITAATTARPVEIQNKTGGSVTLNGLVSSATSSNGILLNNNGGTLINFNGGVTLVTTSNAAFTATSGGTLGVAGSANTITTTTGTAVNLSNITRTTGGIAFRSVSTNGSGTGILLNNVGGTGVFAISGTGTTNSSGGTFANVTNRGISVINTNNVSFSNLTFTNTPTANGNAASCGDLETGLPGSAGCNAAIHLDTVTGATLVNTDITGGVQNGINGNSVTNFSLTNSALSDMGNEVDERGINIRNLLGTNTISNNTINDGYEGNIYIINTVNTASTLTLNSNTLNNSTLGAGARFATSVASNFTVTATNNIMTDNLNAGLIMAIDGGIGNFTATTNTVTNGGSPGITVGGTAGTGTYNISSNTVTNPDFISYNAGASGNMTLSGRIAKNTTDGPESPAANSISIAANGTSSHTALVEGNNITAYDGTSTALIALINQGSATGNITIRNNTVNGNNNIGATNAILARVGSLAADTNTACVAVYGNTVTNWNPALIALRVHLRFNTNTTHFRNGQSGTDQQILVNNNPGVPAGAVAYDTTAPATSTQTNTPCALPAFALQAPAPLTDGDVQETVVGGWSDEKEYINRPVAPVRDVATTDVTESNSVAATSDDTAERDESSVSLAGETITIGLGTLPSNERLIIVFDAIISNPVAAGVNSLSNQGTITGSNFANVLTDDPDITGAANPTLTTLTAAPDYSINKTDSIASVVPGGNITYTLQYTNSGNQGGASVRLTETVPANTTFNAGLSSGGWVCTPNNNAGSTCVNNVGGLNGGGATGSRVFAVTVLNPVAAGVNQISNTASVGDNGANGVDPTPANNSEGETTPVTAQPDLSVTKTDGGVTGTPGSTVVYTITYSNIGNQGASGVVLTEVVPTHTTFNSGASSAGWVCAPNNNAGSTCTNAIGGVAGGGGSGTRLFAVTVNTTLPGGTTGTTNTVTIADDNTNGTDPNTANNTATEPTPILAAPDMRILKSDGSVSTTPGTVVVYTLSYSNIGTIGATGVVITENVPANSTFNAGSSSAGWSCADGSPAGTTCTNTVGTVAVNGSGTRNFAVTVVNPVAAGVAQLSNTATIVDDGNNGTDPNTANNSATDTTPITAAPDLSVTKTDGGTSTTPGGIVSYSLNYANSGNQGATGVVLTEVVPANSTFTAGSSSAGWVCAPNNNAGSTCTNAIGALAGGGANGNRIFSVTVVNPVAAGVTQLSNTVTIADDNTNGADPVPANNTSTDTTPITAQPDLSVTKTDGGVTGIPGSTVVYTITYSNVGNQGATGVVLTEVVPANTTFNAASSSAGWSCPNGSPAGTTCTNSIGSVLAGSAPATRLFAVNVNTTLPSGTTSTSNTVTIADDGANGADPNTTNNTATETTPVFAAPDLQISKSDGGVSVAPAGTVIYTLSYGNIGTIGATGVVITEVVPANSTFNSASSSAGWSCANGSPAGTTCTNTVGTVAVGGTGTRNFAVTVVNPVAAGVAQLSNTATISNDGTNGTDPNTTNNTATDTTPINATPDLRITKSDGGITTTPGSTVAYTLQYTNTGNQGATGVVVSETVPANSTFNSAASTGTWSCANGSPAGTTCTSTVGALAGAGGTGSRIFAVTVVNPVAAAVTQLSNTATIADDNANGADPVPANNSASDTTPITAQPDLSLSKTDGGMSATLGTVIPYTLTVTNTGNQGATGVVITETVPANTTFNAAASSAGWSCTNGSPAGTTCINTIAGTLNGGGATAVRRFAVQVNAVVAPSVTQISNTASTANDNTNGADPTPGNNSASDTTPLNVAASLTIDKSVSATQVLPGQPVTYTIAYGNSGPQLSTNVVITDLIPSQLENVTYSASPAVTASPGITYVWQVGTVLANGTGTINVVGTVDPDIAADTTVNNTATIDGDFAPAASDSVPFNVVLPRVRFGAANVDFTEEAANATITVTLDRANPYRAITVGYATSDGTATAGSDYTAVTGVVTFTAGMTQTSFTIPVLEDTIDETNETVNLTLSAPNGAILGTPVTGTLTILDDDAAPTITVTPAALTVDESDSSATLTVTLSNPSAFTVTVDYATSDGTATAGSDYVGITGTVEFAPGETSNTLDVALFEDTIDETDETFNVALSNPVSGTLGTPASSVVTITDNDAAPTIAFSNADFSTNEGDGTATLTVTLSNPSVFTVTVDYASADGTATAGSDYTATNGTLTFAPGDTSNTFDVAILEDNIDEADETVSLTLTNAVSGTVGTPNPATLTIVDNDGEPTLNFSSPTYSISEAGGAAVITVTLSNPSAFPIAVDYDTANGTAIAGSDYLTATGTVTFTPGMTLTTFSVTILEDTLDEADETVNLTISEPTAFQLGGQDTAVLTILDNDAAPTMTLNNVSLDEGDSGTTPFVFQIALSAPSGLAVSVDYDTDNGTATSGSDYAAASGTVVIPAGQLTATVTVNVNGDQDVEDDETFFLDLSAPVNTTIEDGEGIGTILNDDIVTAVTLSDLRVNNSDLRNSSLLLLPLGVVAAWWLWQRRTRA